MERGGDVQCVASKDEQSRWGVTYSAWRDLGGVLVTAPAATSFMNEVYLVTQGTEARLFRQNTQP